MTIADAPHTEHPDAHADAVELDRLRVAAMVPALRRSYMTSVASIAVFSALLAPTSTTGLLAWLLLRAAVTGWSLWRLRRPDITSAPASQTVRTLALMLLIGGATWGLIPFLVRPDETQWQAVVVLWLFGNQSVVTAVCAPHRRVFLSAIGSVTVVGAAGLLSHGGSFSRVLAALLVLGGVYSASVFRAMHGAATAGMTSQIRNARLAASLAVTNARLEQLSATDDLTMMMNRRHFQQKVAHADGTLCASGALLVIDVDRFKTINDSLGHPVGDHVLATLAARWTHLVEPVGFVARMGGDEFACFVPGATPEAAAELADALRAAATPAIRLGDTSIAVTCSVGVAMVDAGTPMSRSFACADAALYTAKGNGRDSVATAAHTG